MRRPALSSPALPLTSGWYWLLVGLGVGSTAALFASLGPFLGWSQGSLEPVRLALLTAAALWVPVTWPWVTLALFGLAALGAGWLAYTDPTTLARWAIEAWPADTLVAAGRILRHLWLGSYEGLPPPLRTAGTVCLAGCHLLLVYRSARQPRLALWPVVGGALALVTAWFYGSFPQPEGWLSAYLVLALAFASLAHAAVPVNADTLSALAASTAPLAGRAAGRPWTGFGRQRLPWGAIRHGGRGHGDDARGPGSTGNGSWHHAPPVAGTAPGRWAWRLAVQVTALLSITAVLAGLLPPRREPLDWIPLTQAANRLLPFTAAQRTGGWGLIPGTRGAGVPDRQFLGGPFFPDETPLLTVTVTGSQIPAQLYLRSVSRLAYDGRSWGEPNLRATFGPAGDWDLDEPAAPRPYRPPGRRILQHITPLQRVSPGPLALLEPQAVQGQPVPTSRREALRTGAPAVRTVDDTLFWTPRVPGFARYTVESWVPTFDPAAIRDAARRASQHDAVAGGSPFPGFRPGNAPASSPWLAGYLQLPPGLPRRVRDLAREITAGLDNPYDQALAIEAYLRQLPYDLVMPYTPPGRDFVDFFLFDVRRGYCVAFASAAIVMLRSIGLPARWVEGFIVSTGGQAGTYTVTYAQAHAWPEVLIPGYGWVPLEPTPAYPARPLAPPAGAVTEEGGRGGDTGGQSQPDVVTPLPDAALVPPSDATPAGAAGGASGPGKTIGAVALAVAVLTLALWAALRRRHRRRQALLHSPEAAICELFIRLESQLARLGLGRSPAQTAREYVEWLSDRLPLLAPAWSRLGDLYDRARYAPPARRVGPGGIHRHSPAASGDEGREAVEAERMLQDVRALQGEIQQGLQRTLGWRYRWVRLIPDLTGLRPSLHPWNPDVAPPAPLDTTTPPFQNGRGGTRP